MPPARFPIPQGTLDMLILQILSLEPAYGYGPGPDVKSDIEIIGVVADFSYGGLREESEQAYFSIFEGDDFGGTSYVRVPGTPSSAFPSMSGSTA